MQPQIYSLPNKIQTREVIKITDTLIRVEQKKLPRNVVLKVGINVIKNELGRRNKSRCKNKDGMFKRKWEQIVID